jgi:hypothetical protein
VGLLLLVSLVLLGLVAPGLLRLPRVSLARELAARLVCAVELSDSCERDPALVAAYGTELASRIREHAPSIVYEHGMSALPVDFRRCREPRCGDGARSGLIWRSRSGEPVVAFVHVVDCQTGASEESRAAGLDCSGDRAGNLYLQYWLYYPDSATLRDVPVAGGRGFHRDDWESFQVRVGPDGEVDVRASSHHGYNYERGAANWGSDAGIGPLRAVTEVLGLRPEGGWGPDTGRLYVSGGSHAGNAKGDGAVTRMTPRRRLRLVPLESLAAAGAGRYRFAITPPWLKPVWTDPESEGT